MSDKLEASETVEPYIYELSEDKDCSEVLLIAMTQTKCINLW